jgi:hypothetical protein
MKFGSGGLVTIRIIQGLFQGKTVFYKNIIKKACFWCDLRIILPFMPCPVVQLGT